MDANDHSKMGKVMLVLAFLLVLSMMTWFFNDILEHQHNPNRSIDSQVLNGKIAEVILKRNNRGHYIATGTINGYEVEFMLDTGATNIAIPEKLARRLNLKPGPEVEVSTANGTVLARLTRLDRVELGKIKIRDVTALITPSMDQEDTVLLGMSFLKHLEMIQRGDQLILREYP